MPAQYPQLFWGLRSLVGLVFTVERLSCRAVTSCLPIEVSLSATFGTLGCEEPQLIGTNGRGQQCQALMGDASSEVQAMLLPKA